MRVFVPKEMLINTSVKMPFGFTNITSSTVRTWKLINNTCFKRINTKILGLNILSLNGEKIIFTLKSSQYLFIMDEIFSSSVGRIITDNLAKITFNWFVNKPLGKYIAFSNFWKVFDVVRRSLGSVIYFVGPIYEF